MSQRRHFGAVRVRSSLLPVLLLLLALSAIGVSEAWTEIGFSEAEKSSSLLYLPNGKSLRVASMGHSTFLADLIYIWSIQHYSAYGREDSFRFIDHVYGNVIAKLDPRYVDPYLIGSMIMVVEKQDIEAALRLLEQGMEANPSAWILPYEAGFWAHDHLRDYERAAVYFERAMQVPGHPPSIRRVHAEMFNRAGNKRSSLALWTEVYDSSDDERIRAVAANHVHDLTIDVDIEGITAALEEYRRRTGAAASGLQELVTAGLLPETPVDPDGNPYAFDPSTGEIASATPFRLRRR